MGAGRRYTEAVEQIIKRDPLIYDNVITGWKTRLMAYWPDQEAKGER